MQDDVHAVEGNLARGGQVVTQGWQLLLVDGHDGIDGSLSDVEGGGVREEVVSHEEAEQHEIIDDALEIECEGHLAIKVLELQIQILSSNVEFDELELDRLGERDNPPTISCIWALRHQVALLPAPRACFLKLCHECLSDDIEIRFMSAQPEHDQIGVSPIDAVTSVRVIAWL